MAIHMPGAARAFTTALNKVRQHADYHAAARRSPAREVAEPAESIARLYAGFSPSQEAMASELAERTSRTEGAVRTALSRGLARLARLLDGYQGGAGGV